jgi:phage major head subunit gpT-like protein
MASTGTYGVLDNANLIGLFDQMYEQALGASWAQQLGMYVSSDGASETYGWLGAAPTLTELKGEAKAEDGFAQYTFSIVNKEYARAIRIADKDQRRDKIGQLTARIGEMSQKAAEHWDSLVATLITGNGLAYDGQNYFDTDHNESGSNQVNALTASHITSLNVGTAAAPTADEMAVVLPEAVGKFHLLTDDKGDPINGSARNFMLLCGSAKIFASASHAIKANNLTSGASNPVQGLTSMGYSITPVLTPLLSSVTDAFYLFRTDSAVKPFILQEEVPLEAQMTNDQSDEYVKYRRRIFSIYTSRAAGYGRWQSAAKLTLS